MKISCFDQLGLLKQEEVADQYNQFYLYAPLPVWIAYIKLCQVLSLFCLKSQNWWI